MLEATLLHCIACQHDQQKKVAVTRNGLDMVKCLHCGLIFVKPQWTGDVAENIFANSDGWPAGISGGADNRAVGMQFVADQCLRLFPAGGELLDIGCANGEFFNALRSKSPNWRLFGTDPDPRWQGHDFGNAQVIHKSLRQCNFPDNYFDVVTMLDALYYIPSPDLEMLEIARILKPNGLFVFDVLGLSYLVMRGWFGSLFKMERTRTFSAYPFYFSAHSLQLLLERAGLSVETALPHHGITSSSSLMRIIVALYMLGVRGGNQLTPRFLSLSPKIVYITRRLGKKA